METTTRLKRKRVSKNKKKSWRKHTDIKDVEEALDDERLQQRTGGLVAEKTDESLFFVDRTTEEDGDGNRRKRVRPLRCFSNLEPDPNTVAVSAKRRTAKIKQSEEDLLKKREAAIKARFIQAKKLRKRVANMSPAKKSFDLWADDVGQDKRDPFFLEYTKQKPVKPPSHHHDKTSELAPVDVPHPGASYNPAFHDHQNLLSKALEVEIKKEKSKRKLEKELDKKFPSEDQAPTETTWLQEMSAGLFEAPEAPPQEDGDNDRDRLSVNPAVRREDKKTRQQRRIQKERKAQEKAQVLKKQQKKRVHEFNRLKSIKTDIKTREAQLLNKKKRKETLKEKFKNKPKKLGRLKFEEPEVEIKLSDELVGSLRQLKPEGHLLDDRFKALQRRNIIEPRTRAKYVRKYKPKKFEKKGHKAIQV